MARYWGISVCAYIIHTYTHTYNWGLQEAHTWQDTGALLYVHTYIHTYIHKIEGYRKPTHGKILGHYCMCIHTYTHTYI